MESFRRCPFVHCDGNGSARALRIFLSCIYSCFTQFIDSIPGSTIRPLRAQLGNVEPSVRVGVAGDSPANVRQAKQVIKDLCSYHHHAITHPGMVHEEVYVPEEFYHCVIGPRGSEIKHIRGNYRVDVHMPSHESWCTTENVVCVGKPADVKKAVSYIQLLMDRNTEQRDQKYSDEQYGDGGW